MPARINVEKLSVEMCEKLLRDLERGKRPVLEATKCSLDNSLYNPKVGYLTPGDKKVQTELNVSSVKKMSRTIFVLELILRNIESGANNTKREVYYIAKGEIKHNPTLKPLDFEDQNESDEIIDFICEMMECYREDLNCFANDRGGQTYSGQLIVEETMPDGDKAVIDLSKLGTAPFQPKNRPQSLKLKARKKIDFCLIVESEGTANTLVSSGFTKRNNVILLGAQGVPSNAVRGWTKLIQEELAIPIYFFGDLDAYTLQNIFRTLKAGSAASLIRNQDFSAPDVKFLGVLPEDIKKYDLPDYAVKENDATESRALKKARDALENDPFFQDKKNKGLSDILKWLLKNKRRCEQQSFFSVNPRDPLMPEKIILDKIKNKNFV
ncbi:MAG: DNA topoisomerase VI [Deltaproteobacteria bacterium RIFCSPLOWO2_12_FULL_40_28]|nr:MAG: DNA topoisomerase VI [Deltaproteobacteria bacterium RIFCSPHIGHO2_02_FULL_40_28]OGQ19051.1 MAG: DNA topoisomerase VI [Deltaproteobacteria bacterium RIFCSPHIGHO2_12_FULL_40_32]OGQ40223.1 MAG: DNA topoisomerase VI [Deltaproteobacteria bacterium RIFCSPLOWO2_02_FULL_40_36]OGQ53494.1 MAG: DNA topoisomerase VI [Deltaproteobacteria bacterium RIFCSPLOWO2_12_FULL_40_28]